MFLLACRVSVPAPPRAQRLAHDEFFVRLIEPRRFFGEHRHALRPGTRHLRDIRPPEHAVRPERVVNLLQIFVHDRKGIGLAGIPRRPGRLDRDVGEFGQRQQFGNVRHGRMVLERGRAASTAQMVDGQSKAGITLGDTSKFRKRIFRKSSNWNAGALGGGP